jgi:hypothetical protein
MHCGKTTTSISKVNSQNVLYLETKGELCSMLWKMVVILYKLQLSKIKKKSAIQTWSWIKCIWDWYCAYLSPKRPNSPVEQKERAFPLNSLTRGNVRGSLFPMHIILNNVKRKSQVTILFLMYAKSRPMATDPGQPTDIKLANDVWRAWGVLKLHVTYSLYSGLKGLYVFLGCQFEQSNARYILPKIYH